jgi:hypothetical protein
VFAVSSLILAEPTYAADGIEDRVVAAGARIAKSKVTLWSASADAPKQLAQTQANDDGRFSLNFEGGSSGAGVLYTIAKGGEPQAHDGGGDNPAIAMLCNRQRAAGACDYKRVHDCGVGV